MLPQVTHNRAEITLLKLSRVMKAESPSKFTLAFEAGLSRMMLKDYNLVAKKALDSALKSYKGNETEAQVKAIEKALERQFAKLGTAVEKDMGEMVEIYYKEVTAQFIEDHGLAVEKASRPRPSMAIDFNLADADAIAATERITVQSAGRYFPDQLSSKTSEIIRSVVLQSGLSIKDAAKLLEDELKGALGLKFGDVVPTKFETNPGAYFDIVATNASVQASNVGRMIAMADAGIEKYRVTAILDRRTSTICQSLNGKEFEVGKGMQAVDKFLGVQSIDDLENVMGFTKDGSVPKWAGEGVGFPPYHHSCRTTVVPVF